MPLAKWFTNGPKQLATSTSWTTDTIKVMLCSASYTPNQDTHEFKSSVTNELPTANGYTLRGATLATKTATSDAATNETRLGSAPVVWTAGSGQTLTARYAVVYKDTGTDGTSPLLGWVDFEADVSATNDTFTITPDATGWLKITTAA
jgi:hypothetical protein